MSEAEMIIHLINMLIGHNGPDQLTFTKKGTGDLAIQIRPRPETGKPHQGLPTREIEVYRHCSDAETPRSLIRVLLLLLEMKGGAG